MAKQRNYVILINVVPFIFYADVSKKGKVTFNRSIPAHATNPIIEVNLEDNTLGGYKESYHHGANYLKDVVVALEHQHHYAQINLVGHSMGNLEIINCINDKVNNQKLPQVAHLVAIAGHYDGGVWEKKMMNVKINSRTGKPNKMDSSYWDLLRLRKTLPRNTAVFNIYGDLQDGSHSDGDVPVNSAKSLNYLVAGRAKSYREVEIRGRKGQHSKLHHNDQVNRELIKFLWEK
ncbi:MAG TPA: alpha/beta hydrolase [Candidatus Limosilactobacillus merdigallinarum]|uniref:Alpha/beta hydrolase n=1 Tax=Candidatus Limosilactobacillus merdigallinarum TaxID=2838652 RepID=A0A9D1VH36_9LACO|nr:alpha/beta hydrolase [Candidatus Limosilactobacillus merdigallinarum]